MLIVTDKSPVWKAASAVWGPGGNHQGGAWAVEASSGLDPGRGPGREGPGTSSSFCEDPEVEGAPKPQREIALPHASPPQTASDITMAGTGTVGTFCLNPTGWGRG